MLQLVTFLQAFVADRKSDEGATAVEYGLMVALIAVAIIATVAFLGGELNQLFTGVGDRLNPGADAPA